MFSKVIYFALFVQFTFQKDQIGHEMSKNQNQNERDIAGQCPAFEPDRSCAAYGIHF